MNRETLCSAVCVVMMAAVCVPGVMAADSPVPTDEAQYAYIEQLIEDGEFQKAEDLLADRLLSNKKDIVGNAMLAELYRVKGNRKKSVEVAEAASSIDPNYPEPYFVKAKAYLGMEQFDRADEAFSVFKEKMKPFLGSDKSVLSYYLSALQYMAGEFLSQKRYDDFRSVADEIIALNPNDQSAYYNLGIYYYEYKHDRSSAYKALDKSMKIDPANSLGKKARYAIEYIRTNPDSRVSPDFSFIDREYKD